MLSKKGIIIIVAGIIGVLLCCGVTSCVTGIGRASGGSSGVDFDSDGHSKKKTKSKKSKSKKKTSKRGHYIHLADVYQVVNAG